jgi:RimJ/RimL family protein N-acetyltransferase
VIETERLRLRRWHEADRAPFAAMGADPEVMRFFEAPLSRAESDALIDRIEAQFDRKGYGMWAVERRDDGAFLGFTGLFDVEFASPIEGDVEVGWRFACAAWGQGYAFEAATAALAFAATYLAVPRIVSMTVVANTRSWGLMERLGLFRRPDLDFDHPRLPAGHALRPHIVYATTPAGTGGAIA